MSITTEEKEALFAEFKARLENQKQGYASGYETVHNMEQSKDYFWAKYDSMTKNHAFDIWSPKGIMSYDWDMIRKLVCHATGVSIVKQIQPDKLKDVNDLAMKIIDLLFDYNEKILNELEGAV